MYRKLTRAFFKLSRALAGARRNFTPGGVAPQTPAPALPIIRSNGLVYCAVKLCVGWPIRKSATAPLG